MKHMRLILAFNLKLKKFDTCQNLYNETLISLNFLNELKAQKMLTTRMKTCFMSRYLT